jgi:predicted Rossmann fold nucleotide-binding protein DprA/Smf involved in DNA uptake
MHDRRAGRGGAHDEQRELLAELDDEPGADAGGAPAAAGEDGVALRRIAITGNRGITDDDRATIRRRIGALVRSGEAGTILFGGALGADTEALRAALAARRCGAPRLVVVLPDTLEAQPRGTWAASRRADERVELRRPIRAEDRWRAYHGRNRYLVEHADALLAFWNGDPRSGTAATITLARKRGLAVEIVDVEGGD